MTLKLNAKLKSGFFDRASVMNALGAANTKAMGRSGAYIQKAAQRNVRKRKRSSKPGKTPTAWLSGGAKNAFLRKILFALDSERGRLIIGPIKLNIQQRPTAPKLLEHGGRATLPAMWQVDYRDGTTHIFRRFPVELLGSSAVKKIHPPKVGSRHESQEKIRFRFQARPFMRPALEKSLPKVMKFWESSIKGRKRPK